MAIRFRKSIRLAKGVRLNVGKSGVGISAGVRGARIGVGPRGTYSSVGIPGTGIYAINYHRTGKGKGNPKEPQPITQEPRSGYQPVFVTKQPAGLNWYAGPLVTGIISFMLLITLNPFGIIGAGITFFWYNKVKYSNSKLAKETYIKATQARNTGDWATALEETEKVAQLLGDKELGPGIILLSLKANQKEKAIDLVDQWLLENPSTEQQLEAALLLMEYELWAKALEIMQNLPQSIKEQLPLLNLQATCLLEMGHHSIALELLKTGPTRRRKMDADLVEFRYLLGKAYLLTGDKKRALNSLEKVMAVDMGYKDVIELTEQAED